MNRAMQTRIENADRAQNVNSRELIETFVLSEQRVIHHRAFSWAGYSKRFMRRSHPGGARQDLIIGYPPAIDHNVVSHCASNALPESDSDRFDRRAEKSG